MKYPQVETGRYRHYKGGEYDVLGVGYHSESVDPLVLYQSCYDTPEFPKGTLWVRPIELFLGATQDDVQRFTKL